MYYILLDIFYFYIIGQVHIRLVPLELSPLAADKAIVLQGLLLGHIPMQ